MPSADIVAPIEPRLPARSRGRHRLAWTTMALAMAMSFLWSGPVLAGKAVNFTFTDIDHKTVRLSDFKGQWVLVNFWAPWCPLCWLEVPMLNELDQRKDVTVIGVSLDYGPDENVVRESVQQHNFQVSAIVAGGSRRDPNSPYRQVGPVDFYPTSYLYDPTGEIVMFVPGLVNRDKLLAFMEQWRSEHRKK